jgi:hypothetical protein
MKKSEQKRKVAQRQRTWATMAEKDAKNNAASAKRERKAGNAILAKDSEKEAKLDKKFGRMRKQIATKTLRGVKK